MEPITYTSGDRIETQRKAIDQAIKIFGIEEKLSIDQVERIVDQLINRLCKAHGYSSSEDTFVIEMEIVQVATKLLFIKALCSMSDFATDAEENQIAIVVSFRYRILKYRQSILLKCPCSWKALCRETLDSRCVNDLAIC